jgi:hypothetical protein
MGKKESNLQSEDVSNIRIEVEEVYEKDFFSLSTLIKRTREKAGNDVDVRIRVNQISDKIHDCINLAGVGFLKLSLSPIEINLFDGEQEITLGRLKPVDITMSGKDYYLLSICGYLCLYEVDNYTKAIPMANPMSDEFIIFTALLRLRDLNKEMDKYLEDVPIAEAYQGKTGIKPVPLTLCVVPTDDSDFNAQFYLSSCEMPVDTPIMVLTHEDYVVNEGDQSQITTFTVIDNTTGEHENCIRKVVLPQSSRIAYGNDTILTKYKTFLDILLIQLLNVDNSTRETIQ